MATRQSPQGNGQQAPLGASEGPGLGGGLGTKETCTALPSPYTCPILSAPAVPDSDTASQPPTAEAKPAPKAKPPAPEDKPFGTFVPELLLPALAKDIQGYGGAEPELEFSQGAMPVVGSPCWMVKGSLPGERRFWLCFTAEDISSAKTIAVAEAGAEPSLLESFLIDEKKITLALLVSRLVQRLNGQKWLGPN